MQFFSFLIQSNFHLTYTKVTNDIITTASIQAQCFIKSMYSNQVVTNYLVYKYIFLSAATKTLTMIILYFFTSTESNSISSSCLGQYMQTSTLASHFPSDSFVTSIIRPSSLGPPSPEPSSVICLFRLPKNSPDPSNYDE